MTESSNLSPSTLPRRIRRGLGHARRFLRGLFYSGSAFHCPCCGRSFRAMLSFGEVEQRPNVRCPRCDSLERHRLIWLFLHQKTNITRDPLRVLHFAPEPIFYRALKKLPNLQYDSADIDPTRADLQMDICDIRLERDSCDVLLCIHVLEHVPDDRKAMSELYRVLKPGGVGADSFADESGLGNDG